ncbi:MAG TPA: two-component regulator propeller domain-containing protein, partial [Mucilaginibacter sp.]|nr:two-component regulator propeller domain-containing protein [Mucilaginibacter sp.]
MNIIKRFWYILVTVAFASCNNNPPASPPPNSALKPIVVKPLEFDNEEKINWVDSSLSEQPVVSKINISSLPTTPYGTFNFKPFSKTVEEARFDYNDLPGKELDISKLTSKPLKFDTCILGPPKSVIAGPLHLNNLKNASLFEMGEAQGLKGARVTCLLTDHDGFMWIATDLGVYRYDGQNLLQYIPVHIEHSIFSMLQDKSGQIWMGTHNGGLLVLEPQTGLIKTLSTKQGLSNENIARMIFDDQQRIWVTTLGGGVNIIDPKKQTIKILSKSQGLSAPEAFGITQDANHNIWIATFSNGVDLIDIKNNKIRYINKTNGLKKDSLTVIVADRYNRIWIAPYPGGALTVIDIAKKSIRYINDSQGPNVAIWTLIPDNKNHIWAGTSTNGVQVIDLDNKRIKRLHTTSDLNGDASGDFVENINQDNRGQVWMATRNGLNVLKENNTVTERIGTSSAACLLEDHNGIIWEGTFKEGVKIVDRKKQVSRQLTSKEGLQDNNVQIIKEINGEIFICTNSGLDIVSSDRKTIRHLSNIHTKNWYTTSFAAWEQQRTVPNVISDKTGKLWVSSNRLYIIDLKKRIVRSTSIRPNDYASYLLQDNQGNVWISTVLNGIGVINEQAETIKYLKNSPKLETGFKVLLKDDEGNIWIGTSKGIYVADLKNNKLVFFSVQQGLISEDIISLLKHSGHIYACTQKGITVITPGAKDIAFNKKWGIESFGADYGLTKATMDYYNTDLVTKDGLYWWRGDGITLLNLAPKDTFASRCYITGVSLLDEQKKFMDPARANSGTFTRWGQNKPHYYKSTSGSPDLAYLPDNNLNWQNVAGPYNMPVNLQLSYDQNFIQFQYTSLDLVNSGHDTYRYILEGSDKKWSDVTTSTSSKHYFSLKPGLYTFKVIALGLHGIWTNPAQLSFTIKPPWWQTWWAFL